MYAAPKPTKLSHVSLPEIDAGNHLLINSSVWCDDAPILTVLNGSWKSPITNCIDSTHTGAETSQNLGQSKSIKNGCDSSCVFNIKGVKQPKINKLPSNQCDRGSPM